MFKSLMNKFLPISVIILSFSSFNSTKKYVYNLSEFVSSIFSSSLNDTFFTSYPGITLNSKISLFALLFNI